MPNLSDLRLVSTPVVPEGITKQAAVAVTIGDDDAVCFIRRADREGDLWSGHFAFPGGRFSRGDTSIQATAERETMEEIGLDLSTAQCLGALDCQVSPVRDPDGGLGVFPFVYRVVRWTPFVLSDEVASVHPIALQRLLSGEGRETFPYRFRDHDLLLPCVRLDDVFIWGMTLRMLDDLLARLRGVG